MSIPTQAATSPRKQAGLNEIGAGFLETAWAIGFPQTQGAGTGAAVLGDTLFISGGNKLLALDAAAGCAKWVNSVATRNTPTIADLDGRKVLAFAAGKDVQVVDAATGELIWKANGQPARTASA